MKHFALNVIDAQNVAIDSSMKFSQIGSGVVAPSVLHGFTNQALIELSVIGLRDF